ncbi:MAG: PKD domain-containing protein [Candidatus Moraniibacteriota bacterium]
MKQKINLFFWFFIGVFFISINNSQAADINASASRTSGVAPLSVFFNADLNASSDMEKSFHELEYSWDFGDGGSGNWGTDGKSKNTDKGPVSFHVYDNPGVYNATLTVRNSSGITVTDSWEITVTDPDVFYVGTNTTCISTGTDFTGCPSGAIQVTTNDLSNFPSYTTSGKRVLLKRGNSWNTQTDLYPDYPTATSDVYIGAFGSCASPDAMGICANAPELTITPGIDPLPPFINIYHTTNWKIIDLSFVGDKSVVSVLGASEDIRQVLVYRLKIRGFDVSLGNGHWRGDDNDLILENAFVSNDIQSAGSYCFYGGGDRFALMGNQFHNADLSHVTRVWWIHVGVIGHNYISGASLANMNGRHALKFHGPKYGTEVGDYATTGGYGLPYPTQFTVIQNNVFGTSGPWPVGMGPQDAGSDERLSDVIFEKNKFIADWGNSSPILLTQGLRVQGRHATVRNNILDTSYDTEDPGDYIGIVVPDPGVTLSSDDVNIYNNTIYYNGNLMQNGITGIAVQDINATNIRIRNNLVSFPNETNPTFLIDDDSGGATMNNNLLTDAPYFVDPDNINPLSRNFLLTSNSTEAIGQGFTVPVLDDFLGNPRDSFYDIGAFEYNAGDMVAPSNPMGLSVL